MEKVKRSDDIVDPLAKYWGLSLFPSTFSAPHSKPYDDLDAVHNHLKSMALQSPAKVVEQTKAIVGEDLELFISENSTRDERNDAAVAEEGREEVPRRRRPGLGLKRAPPRFSLKQPKKQTVEDLLPTLDLDKLKDPVEFFLAHEKLANAKKEIEKQLGIVSNQDNVSTKPRQRRPGLPGFNRRPVSYRHRYPIETWHNNDDAPSSQEVFGSGNRYVPSSQEVFGSGSRDPVDESTDKEEACFTPLENEVTGSSAIEENKLDNILQGLLSCDPEDLEGDGGMNLLQERLQIKPIVFEKLSLPDIPSLPDNQPVDLKPLRENLSKPRKALSNIDNLLKGMNNKTPIRRNLGSTVQQLASPTPPRSPFALLSSLQKHISRSKPSVDPFSAHEIGHLSAKSYSPTHVISQEINLGSGKLPNELNAHMIEDNIAASETNTILDTCENSKEDNSGKSSDKLNAPLIENTISISETSVDEDPVRNSTITSQKFVVDNSKEPGFDANVDMDVDTGESGMEKRAIDDTLGRQNSEANKMLAENTQELTTSMHAVDLDFENSKEPGFDANVDMDVDIGESGMEKRATDDTLGRQNSEANKMLAENTQALTTSMPAVDLNFDNSKEPGFDANVDMDGDIGESSMDKRSMDDSLGRQNSEANKMLAENTEALTTSMPAVDLDFDNSKEPGFDANVDMDGDIGESGMEKRAMDDTLDRQNCEANKMLAENTQASTTLVNPLADESSPAEFQANSVDKRRSDDDPKHCSQEKTDSTMAPVNGQKRAKLRSRKESKDKRLMKKRQSLGAAGTSWNSGLRRSTRNRTRPLEYWKGERPVYGRVHESLTTVIGVKCMSPGTDGKPKMKVKSYVSDKYKELLEIASLY